MPLTNAALLPHSPLLIPEIGKANHSFLQKTANAYREIAEDLATKRTEIMIIISPHGSGQSDSFTINTSPELEISLRDFGFIPPATEFKGATLLIDKIKNTLRPNFPLQLVSEKILDHGSAIPLYLLKETLSTAKIIIISPANELNSQEHFEFGLALRKIIDESDKNIAVIASGDLSHRLKKKSPGGYSSKGAKFDNKLIEYLSEKSTSVENILKMDSKLIKDAAECGLKPLMILLGVLGENEWETNILSYQTDFGIGYLSANFKL